jgi:hypothetical protein
VSKGSTNSYLFICQNCNHNYNKKLKQIKSIMNINKDKLIYNCPFCCTPPTQLCTQYKKCITCFNKSLASHQQAIYWNYELNYPLTPYDIFKGGRGKYWFNCEKCNCNFKICVGNVCGKHQWCPTCKNKTEGFFHNWLNTNYNYKIIYQTDFNWCKSSNTNHNLPFDFCIEELKLIIEIDGPQHFQQIAKWKTPEQTFKNDTYKIQQAFNNNYSIIRIYQPDILYDTNNWDTNFNKIFRNYKIPKTPFMVCIGDQDLYEKYNNLHISPKINRPSANCFNCKICNQTFKLKNRYELHIKSKKHQKNLSIKK